MTYLEYLLIFIIIPSLVLLIYFLNLKRKDFSFTLRKIFLPIIILSFIALIYTTPWDNYLVANKIWWYDSSKVLGIIVGYVPIEEYSFFILETIFVSLLVSISYKHNIIQISDDFKLSFSKTKVLFLTFLIFLWLFSISTFFIGISYLNYLNLLLIWSIPPIFIQLFIGWSIFFQKGTRLISLTFLIGGYLSLSDAIAIYLGIWTINPNFITGVKFYSLPIEEMLFFYITTILIVFGNILITVFSSKSYFNQLFKINVGLTSKAKNN
jgi:lycopene cyclase domain-containing protein